MAQVIAKARGGHVGTVLALAKSRQQERPATQAEDAMTYYESAEGMTISAARAMREVRAHGCDADDFLAEMGRHATYSAQAVLDWLGY